MEKIQGYAPYNQKIGKKPKTLIIKLTNSKQWIIIKHIQKRRKRGVHLSITIKRERSESLKASIVK